MTRILVVDDESLIADSLCYSLRLEGFEVDAAADGPEALRLAELQPPDLVVLDLILPSLDGVEVCRRLRQASQVPIIMLTARSEEADRIAGLETGADDYLPKPFSFRELLAHIRALLRRVALDHYPRADSLLTIGKLSLDRQAHRVTKAGVELELTSREYALLDVLMHQAGRALARDDLLSTVWGPGWVGDPRTLDVHIRWLRVKIEDDPADPRYIQTVRSVGYRFAGAEEFEAEA